MANNKLEFLNILVGEWEVKASIDGKLVGPDKAYFAWTKAVFSRVEGGQFVAEHIKTLPPEPGAPPESKEFLKATPSSVVALIGLDDTSGQFTQLYADARGVYRVYQMSFDGKAWKLWRDAPGFNQRFEGKFSEDGSTITAYWEMSEDGKTWQRDFDLVYDRLK